MTTYTEPRRPLEFLLWEVHSQFSRAEVTLAASQGALPAGTVLAKDTASGNYVVYNNASGTAGVNVAAGILAYPADNVAATQKIAIIERFALVKDAELNWATNDATGITAGKADLLANDVKVA